MTNACNGCRGGHCQGTCVSRVPIFSTLKKEELAQVATLVQRREYLPRDLVFHAGDPMDSLYIVRFGRVKLLRSDAQGEEAIVDILQPGDFYGGDSLSATSFARESGAAMEHTGLCLIRGEDLTQLIRKNPEIGLKIIAYLSDMRENDRRLIHILSLKDAGRRVAELLLWQSERQPDAPLTFSQEEMARMAGLTHETVNRKLAQLKKLGIIRIDGYKNLSVHDRAALENWAG